MKKIIILAIASFISASTFAQTKGFTAGLRLGTNLSQVRGNDLSFTSGNTVFNFRNNEDRAFGFVGGVFLRFGRTVFLQPEILVSQKGGKYDLVTDNGNNTKTVDFRMTNLDLPLLVGVKLGNVLRINAGPIATFNIGDNGKLGDAIEDARGESAESVYKKAVFGYQAGVGFDLGQLNFDVRYEGNVNDIIDVKYKNAETASKFAAKGNSFQATIGFHF
ncbi:porin family protein [Emticicia sp. BO119]|uniref:porin family protein n=1 Tax=Emticicia sp. BO119 TaxID=2757768 RepID=UPI0015F0F136|nr:porin family protein [Emticicia sp. BO119]MBA4854011.1 PorT family protein [Emticicia sp. BO119]